MSYQEAPKHILYSAYPEGGGPQSALGQILANIAYILTLTQSDQHIKSLSLLAKLQEYAKQVSTKQGGNPISGQGLPPVEEY